MATNNRPCGQLAPKAANGTWVLGTGKTCFNTHNEGSGTKRIIHIPQMIPKTEG